MPTYVILLNWTEQGIRDFKNTMDRAAAGERLAEQLGGSLKEVYWTVGPYDMVEITEFPDDESSTAFLLALGAAGNVRTTTLRAFNRDDMASVVGKVP